MIAQTIFTILLSATAGIAAPLESRDEKYFTPSAMYKYNVRDTVITDSTEGYVTKYPENGGNDITTLVTFQYPEAARGKKCRFAFYLDHKESFAGSGKLDVYSSLKPVPVPRPSWLNNQRNNHLGRLNLKVPGYATWDATYGAYMTQKTDCKNPGELEGFELVGVFDRDIVYWDPKVSGPRIVYTNN